MKHNINSKEYWESRFVKNWNKGGEFQTTEYAKANIKYLPVAKDFSGTILDFGCALGDAVPVYRAAFPKAILSAIDISETAIEICKKKYGSLASFFAGSHNDVPDVDVIIASHVMEHITDDKKIIAHLVTKCTDLFVFVPFKESPLFIEHVNYYDLDYFDDLNVVDKKVFKVEYLTPMPLKPFLRKLLKLQFKPRYAFSKDIIMYHLKGTR